MMGHVKVNIGCLYKAAKQAIMLIKYMKIIYMNQCRTRKK